MQRLKQYLNYFFFIALNFNPLLAICIIYDEVIGERKYKINTTDIEEINKLNIKDVDTSNSNEYMPSNFVLLEKVFTELNKYKHNKTFLDIGCGKGRTLFVAAHFGFEMLTGVEFIQAYCNYIQTEITKIKPQFPSASFQISCLDATQYTIPANVQTLFFYNPFNEKVMDKVIQNILASLSKAKRTLYIIYLSPVYQQKFIDAGFEEIYYTVRFNYLKASILRLKEGQQGQV